MRYEFIYKEVYSGCDEYGECSIAAKKTNERLLTFFYQRWLDGEVLDYGFVLGF